MSGSVTATICMTPWSSSFCTRWRTAASDRPTALPIAAYGRRPSSWSCSMIAFDTSSSRGGGAVPVTSGHGHHCAGEVDGPASLHDEFVAVRARMSLIRLFGASGVSNTASSRLSWSRLSCVDTDSQRPGSKRRDRTPYSAQLHRRRVRRRRRRAHHRRGRPGDRARRTRTAPLSGRRGRRRGRWPPPRAAFDGWRDTTPGERQLALLRDRRRRRGARRRAGRGRVPRTPASRSA